MRKARDVLEAKYASAAEMAGRGRNPCRTPFSDELGEEEMATTKRARETGTSSCFLCTFYRFPLNHFPVPLRHRPQVDAEVSGTNSGALAGGLADTLRTGNVTSQAALWAWIHWRAVQAERRRRDTSE